MRFQIKIAVFTNVQQNTNKVSKRLTKTDRKKAKFQNSKNKQATFKNHRENTQEIQEGQVTGNKDNLAKARGTGGYIYIYVTFIDSFF